MKGRPPRNAPLAKLALALTSIAAVTAPARADDFHTDVQPLLTEYCLDCHSTRRHKGDLDLEAFTSLDAIRKHPRPWQKVLEQLADGEMPPKDEPQPTPEQKARLVRWTRATLDAIALSRAGDPGRVVLRRLSNAEYTYTLRDLTGLDTLDPAREFPVDGAAGEGFTNTGQALVMSPALVTKYLDAAKDVAAHAVLLPGGLRFSPHTTRRDWTNQILADIRALYAQYTEQGEGASVNLQGIAFKTNEGGRIPLAKYLAATIEHRATGKAVATIARERNLSPKYLATLYSFFTDRTPAPLLDDLRARWRATTTDTVPTLAADIARWQRALWKFGAVGHIGKLNGPKAWMEPATPLFVQRQITPALTVPTLNAPYGNAIARNRSAFDELRRVFPAALCYTKIVPVDEVVTLTLFHREDAHLADLMLDDADRARLDRLWADLRFVSQDALTLVDAFEQIWQYATQDADPKVFEPMRKPIADRAAAFRQQLLDAEPKHVDAVLALADRAYRRPLTTAERSDLRALYRRLRDQDLPHDSAIRLLIARVLVSPAFLYRAETPAPSGVSQAPVSDTELATRLSYFLWSSLPDDRLRAAATANTLHHPDTLAAHARRMTADPRARRLAIEFACQWLHVRDFDTLDEKSDRHFPTFGPLRGAMYEETIRFFTDLFKRDGSVLDILDADHTFLNEPLAKHYGIPNVTGPDFRRVDGIKPFGRGGILTHATTLSKQSGASRTSPILRGNWIAEALLGDKLPRPPKDVPQLPEDESAQDLTMRQLTEKHTSDPRCSSCHARIDPFGFSLESFDAIGRLRDKDLGNRPIDTRATVMDGTQINGPEGLRHYLLTTRRAAFLRQFSRKLLGYALGRSVQLSDEPLLTDIQKNLAAHDYRISTAIDTIVRSQQFREIRSRDTATDED